MQEAGSSGGELERLQTIFVALTVGLLTYLQFSHLLALEKIFTCIYSVNNFLKLLQGNYSFFQVRRRLNRYFLCH